MDNKIFISYCLTNESVVNEIDESFPKGGVNFIRDKRNTDYKDSFKEFMKGIRSTDSVLMVVSDAYLKSRNCMYEVLETLKDENYKERIYPIVLSDAKIYSPAERLDYLDYWKDEHSKLKESISKFSPDEVISVISDLKIIRDINGSIVDFISIVSDLKNIPLETLKRNQFKEIKQKLGIQVVSKSKIRYDLLKQEDVSHAGAKRYSAQILIDSKYSKVEIKSVIDEVTGSLIKSNYYKNEKLKEYFGEKEADVVWLFVANRLSDVRNANWICRTSWINGELDENIKPAEMQGNHSVDEIKIEWNDKYEELSEFYDGYLTTKDSFLSQHDNLFSRNQNIVKPLIDKFNEDLRKKGNFKSVINYVAVSEVEIDEVYSKANDMPFAQNDCKELDKMSQSYFALCHNLFLYYSKKGLETWKEENRIYLMKQDILRVIELSEKIINERNKV